MAKRTWTVGYITWKQFEHLCRALNVIYGKPEALSGSAAQSLVGFSTVKGCIICVVSSLNKMIQFYIRICVVTSATIYKKHTVNSFAIKQEDSFVIQDDKLIRKVFLKKIASY